MKTFKTILFAVLLAVSFSSQAQDLQTSVEKTETKTAPKWKADFYSYYYNFAGTEASSKDDAQYDFDDATLNMQLMSLQYQYSDKWTFQVMATYLDNYVETKMYGPGGLTVYKDRTTGMGDTVFSAFTPLYASAEALVLADVGVSVPTGDIDQKNEYYPQYHYAYNMQNGSGTYDAVTGLTALSFQGNTQLGSHLTGIFRNGRNANGYGLGNLFRADAWVDYNTKWGLTPRLVGYYKHKGAVRGEDQQYSPRGNSLVEFYYHDQINWDVSAALKYSQPVGPVALSAEVGAPLAQGSRNYDNVVVSTEYYGSLNVGGSF
ncbi:MAG: hypothetical protein ACAH59_09340 [Pseudobdellovibrionaceae bacterium]